MIRLIIAVLYLTLISLVVAFTVAIAFVIAFLIDWLDAAHRAVVAAYECLDRHAHRVSRKRAS